LMCISDFKKSMAGTIGRGKRPSEDHGEALSAEA